MTRISITYPERSLFSCALPVRITDINYEQHLAHDKLISMLHEARSQFFLHFNMQESNVEGLGIILSDLAICYQAESFYPDILEVQIALDDPTRCGCDMVYHVSKDNGKTTIATAKTGLVFFDYSNKKVASMPKQFEQSLIS